MNLDRIRHRTNEATRFMRSLIVNGTVSAARDWFGILILLIIIAKGAAFLDIVGSEGAASFRFKDRYLFWGYSYIHLAFPVFLYGVTLLFRRRSHLIALFTVNLVYSLILVGDLWYYRGFSDFLSLHLISEAVNLRDLGKSVFSMARYVDIVFVVDLFVLGFVVFLSRKKRWCLTEGRKLGAILIVVSALFVIRLHIRCDYNDNTYLGEVLFRNQFKSYDTMQTLSPLGYHLFDSVLFIRDHMPYSVSDEDRRKMQAWLEMKNRRIPHNGYRGMLKGKSVIVIQVESMERFVIDARYHGREITPRINGMMRNGLYFPNFYEQTNNGNSSDADLMVNASVYPVRRGSTFFRFPNNRYDSLAEILGRKGYFSRSIHADDGICWNVSKALRNFGFNEVMDKNDFRDGKRYWMGLTDESLFEQVADLIGKDRKPVYYFVVTVSSHMPFSMPEKMHRFPLPEKFGKTLMGKYFQSMHYADRAIGELVDSLEARGLMNDVAIVIYGDHRGVHKYYGDTVNTLPDHESWWDNDFRIPLIIYSGNIQGKRIETTGGQLDVLPTLCYLVGVDEDEFMMRSMGRNLLNTDRSFALLNDGRIVNGKGLTSTDDKWIRSSFEVAELIIRSDYFRLTDKVRGNISGIAK